jgi:phospholipase/carboxylesterase
VVFPVFMRRTTLVACALLAACTKQGGAPEAPNIVVVPFGTQAPDAPLVVVLHGRGDTAEHFAKPWADAGLGGVALEGPIAYEQGRAWFIMQPGLTDEQLRAELTASAQTLWPAITQLAGPRKVIIIGFSQGAMMAYALSALHPDRVAYAFPLAGRAPASLFVQGQPPAPIYATHGVDDHVINIDLGRAAVSAAKADGGNAELHEVPGLGHQINADVLADVVQRVRPLLAP